MWSKKGLHCTCSKQPVTGRACVVIKRNSFGPIVIYCFDDLQSGPKVTGRLKFSFPNTPLCSMSPFKPHSLWPSFGSVIALWNVYIFFLPDVLLLLGEHLCFETSKKSRISFSYILLKQWVYICKKSKNKTVLCTRVVAVSFNPERLLIQILFTWEYVIPKWNDVFIVNNKVPP